LCLQLAQHVLNITHYALQVYEILSIWSSALSWLPWMRCIRLLVWWVLLMLSGLTRYSLSLALATCICNVTDTRDTVQKLLEVWIIWIYVLRLSILTALTIHVRECKCL
jgi:hypothetical protein